MLDLLADRKHEEFRKDRDAILVALPLSDGDFAAFEIDVLDSESQSLEDAHSGAVEKRGHEMHRAGELVEQVPDFARGEDDWEAAFRLCACEVLEPRQIDGEDFAIEEEKCGEGLVLSGWSDLSGDGEVREKGLDFIRRQLTGLQRLLLESGS